MKTVVFDLHCVGLVVSGWLIAKLPGWTALIAVFLMIAFFVGLAADHDSRGKR